MMDRANVMRKIRSLVALAAPGSGATPDEASTAKAIALKLMKDHSLTDDDFRPAARKSVRFNFEGNGVSFTWESSGVYGSNRTTTSL